MEEAKDLVEFKLNIFQKMRRSLFLFAINTNKARKYVKLPNYLKNDDKVVEAVIRVNSGMLNKVPASYAIYYINKNPEILKTQYFDIKFKIQVLEKNPEIIEYFEECDLFNFLYNDKINISKEFIKYLSEDMQLKILSKPIQYHELILDDLEQIDENKLVVKEGRPENLDIQNFTGDVIVKFALIDEQNRKKYESYFKNSTYPLKLLERDLSSLNLDTQLKLLCVNEAYRSKCSDEAVKIFDNKNSVEYDDAFHCINENKLYYSEDNQENLNN